MEAAFKRGVDAIRAGEFFLAHEELEVAWRAAPAEERDFFQGLVHVAVAWYQAGRGKPVATARQLEKAERRLAAFAPEHRGVDVADVLTQIAAARERVAAARSTSHHPGFPSNTLSLSRARPVWRCSPPFARGTKRLRASVSDNVSRGRTSAFGQGFVKES